MSHAELFSRLKELQKSNANLKKKNDTLRYQKKRATKLCKSLFHYTLPTGVISDLNFNFETSNEMIRAAPPRALKHMQMHHNESRYNRQRYEQKQEDIDLDEEDLDEDDLIEEKKAIKYSEELAYAASVPPFQPRESRDYSDFNFWKESYPNIAELENLDDIPITEVKPITRSKSSKFKYAKRGRRKNRGRRSNWNLQPKLGTSPRFDSYYSPTMNAQSARCKFFASGYGKCYQGANCRFLHTMSPSLSPMLPPSPYVDPMVGIMPGLGNFSLDRRDSETLPSVTPPGQQQIEKKKAISFWKGMADKHLEQKQFDAAAHACTQVLGLAFDVDSHWKRGLIYRVQGNYFHESRYPSLKQKAVTLHNKAGQDFSEVIKSTPSKNKRSLAYLCRADAFVKRGLWDLALSDANEYLRQRKNEKNKKREGIMAILLNINGYAVRGDIHVALKENQAAIQDYKKAIQTDSANSEKYKQAIKNIKNNKTQ